MNPGPSAVSASRALPATDATRWLAPELTTLPLSPRHCLVRNPRNGASLEISSGEHAVLSACAGSLPLAEHAARAAARLRAPAAHQGAIRELLERCARTGRAQRWIVVDHSHDRANERENSALIARTRLDIAHHDHSAATALEATLLAQFPRAAREIEWLLHAGSAGEATPGRPLNDALLLLAGRAFVCFDDDAVIDPRRPALADAGIAVSDGVDELTWYDGEEALLRDCPPADIDPMAKHSRWQFTLTTVGGLDNSRLLPATTRGHRSTDLLLGAVAHWMYPSAWQVDLPFALLHRREPARQWLGTSETVAPEPLGFIVACLERDEARCVGEAPERRLAAAAALLADLASASDARLAEAMLAHELEVASQLRFAIQTQLDDAVLPAAWKQSLAPWLDSPALSLDARAALAPASGAMRSLLASYAGALAIWPQLWEFCREQRR